MYDYYEFFAGGGMARAGLGRDFKCIFANDIDPVKATAYQANWGGEHFVTGDIGSIGVRDLPGRADLAWASFPCQDLSLAGNGRGLGEVKTGELTRSGTFWLFWRLITSLQGWGRAPKVIVLENVYGTLRSHGGRDFASILSALTGDGYYVGGLVVDAKLFVPQSRPRLFLVAVHESVAIPNALKLSDPSAVWHPKAMLEALSGLPSSVKDRWLWWKLPRPTQKPPRLVELLDIEPSSVGWHEYSYTAKLIGMMSATNRAKLDAVCRTGKRAVGTIYRRTRQDENGNKVQRAEVRFDDVAGCLRTPAGGSSRQTIIIVDGADIRTRLLTAREAARLMGLPETFQLPERYNDAYHLVGDGVVVDVVRHLTKHLIKPLLARPKQRKINPAREFRVELT